MRTLRRVIDERVHVPLLIYGVSRLLVLLATQVAAAASRGSQPLTSFALVWDGIHYVDVVQSGYPSQLRFVEGHVGTSLHAFFPGYPIVVRVVDALSPLGAIGSAILTSVVCGAVATVLLHRLATRLTDSSDVADWSVILFCFFPGSFALGWAFSEGLMLIFVIGAALLLLQDRVWAAGALTALATATRPNAIVFVLCFAWLALLALRRGEGLGRMLRFLGAGVLGASGFLAFNLYLWRLTGEPFAWWRVQREGFGEGVRPGRRTLQVLFDELVSNSRTPAPLFTLFLVLLGLALIAVVLRSGVIPGWLRLYSVLILVLAITSNTGPGSPRLQLVAFPAIIASAHLLREQARAVALASSSMLLVVLVIAYGNPGAQPFYMWAP